MAETPLKFKVPWERYGLIAAVVKALHQRSPQLGKTALQKIVYLLQALAGVQAGYRFRFYTYGPFSVELLQDLDLVEGLEGVKIHRVVSLMGGFSIEPGENADGLIRKASSLLEEQGGNEKISRIVGDFGDLPARDLELRATVVYVVRDLQRREESVEKSRVMEIVGKLKPRFDRSEIESSISDLSEYMELPD